MEEEDVSDKLQKLSLETSTDIPAEFRIEKGFVNARVSQIEEAMKRNGDLALFQMITLPNRTLEEELRTSSPLKFEVRCLICVI